MLFQCHIQLQNSQYRLALEYWSESRKQETHVRENLCYLTGWQWWNHFATSSGETQPFRTWMGLKLCRAQSWPGLLSFQCRVSAKSSSTTSKLPVQCFTDSSCSSSLTKFKLSKQSGYIPTQPTQHCHHHVLMVEDSKHQWSSSTKRTLWGCPLGWPYRTVSDPEHEASVQHLQLCQVLKILAFSKNKRGSTMSPV